MKALSDRDLAKKDIRPRKSDLEDVELVVNKKGDTVSTKAVKLPDGQRFYADNGFQHNVGKHHLANLGQLQMQRAVDLPPKLASVAIAEAMKDPAFFEGVSNQFKNRFDYLQNNHGNNSIVHVGFLSIEILNVLEKRGIVPQSAVISMGDADITHAWRESKVNRNQALPEDVLRRIPEMLLEPDAVYLQADKANPVLWFVYETERGKLVLQIDRENKKSKEVVNIIRTGGKIFSWNAALKQHILLWGKELED